MISHGGLTLLAELKKLDRQPKNIEFAKVGKGFFANTFNSVSGSYISHSVSTGYDLNLDIALQKSLTEFVERKAYSEAFFSGIDVALESSTDGFAAFPILGNEGAAKKACRQNALQEAVERYVWASWWDCSSLGASLNSSWQPRKDSAIAANFATEVESRLSISRYFLIEPDMEDHRFSVVIIFAQLVGGGFISGGACELRSNKGMALDRAMAELVRHAIALASMKRTQFSSLSFYENRLRSFGTGLGDEIVCNRLSANSRGKIKLPNLKFDQTVDHSPANIVAVHRCLFDDQPPFVSGDLMRLCL